MYIEQLYTNCLAEAAYYIESEGEAAIIDPIRETEPYLNLARERGASIKYILETHFHADFVSGHLDLARQTGAPIVFGSAAKPAFDFHAAAHGEVLQIGNLMIKVLHTPGHTPESVCYLLHDEQGKPQAIFTGDTLFVGDVGRPDLLDGAGVSQEEQAAAMYHTLNTEIKTLPAHVVVYPAHGPGSMCGKSIGKEKQSTIGQELEHNYALQAMSQADFISSLLDNQPTAPQYFSKNVEINQQGYDSLNEVIARNFKRIDFEDLEAGQDMGALILDTRPAQKFSEDFIKGAIQIGLDGSFAVWVGTLIDINRQLMVVAEKGREKEAILRLARVGYENVLGYIPWPPEGKQMLEVHYDSLKNIKPDDFVKQVAESQDYTILDVRRPDEYKAGHVENALHIPLRDLPARLHEVPPNTRYVYCGGGYRSVIACSILKAKGYNDVINVEGGWEVIQKLMISETV